jgi:hypothetical protein
MAKSALDLAELDLKDILQELERRLECATKPEKRLVLLGARTVALGFDSGRFWPTEA